MPGFILGTGDITVTKTDKVILIIKITFLGKGIVTIQDKFSYKYYQKSLYNVV